MIDMIQQTTRKMIFWVTILLWKIPTPQIAAIVDSEVDCGICIMFATNKLNVAADKIIITDLAVIKSTGIIPFPKVSATPLPKKTAPRTAKTMKSKPAPNFPIALLPTAVENDPAKLVAPILMAKKQAMSMINISIF